MTNKITIYPGDPLANSYDRNGIEIKHCDKPFGDGPSTEIRSYPTIGPINGKITEMTIMDLPSGGKMIGPATADVLREYITRDMDATEALRKRAEIEQTITEALHMQARGHAAPLPRPTMIAMCIRAVCDDLESWSSK